MIFAGQLSCHATYRSSAQAQLTDGNVCRHESCLGTCRARHTFFQGNFRAWPGRLLDKSMPPCRWLESLAKADLYSWGPSPAS